MYHFIAKIIATFEICCFANGRGSRQRSFDRAPAGHPYLLRPRGTAQALPLSAVRPASVPTAALFAARKPANFSIIDDGAHPKESLFNLRLCSYVIILIRLRYGL